MARPYTLFTGQWADLPFEEVARLASGWGYDGLEIAVSGDHLDAWRWDEPGYVEAKLAAIHIHVSQHPDIEAMDRTVRGLMLRSAERGGLQAGRSAEAFHVVTVNGAGTIAGF